MKKADLSRLETLEALIAEKRKQETFLAKLHERRAGTPEHVFKRLEDEYLTKLMDAQVRAAAEAETLSGGLEDDDAAVAEVEGRLAQLEEERIEMQLRAEVEEWEPKETQKKLTAMTAAISMAEKERDARKTVAERTRALLTEARGGASAGAAPSAPSAAGRPPMRPTTAQMTAGPNFDELAFLNSVVGRPSSPSLPIPVDYRPAVPADEIKESPSAKPPAPKPAEPAPAPAARHSGQVPRAATPAAPSAAVTESVASPAVPASPAPAPAPTPAAAPAPAPAPEPQAGAPAQPSLELEAPKPAALPAAEKPPQAAAPKAAEPEPDEEEPSSPLGRPTPRTSQAIKTLKCAECGSMNYPTEWYCERCGGELAAL